MRLVALAILIFGEAPWGAVGPLARPFDVLSHRSPAVMPVLALTYASHSLPNVPSCHSDSSYPMHLLYINTPYISVF